MAYVLKPRLGKYLWNQSMQIRCMATIFNKGVEVRGDIKPEYEHILTKDAVTFVAEIHRKFNNTRLSLLDERIKRQKIIDEGGPLTFPVANHDDNWKVAPIPNDLQRRHVEITGPVDRKMIINALNSGSDVFMADFEDSCSPTWHNMMDGQINLLDANKGTIELTNPDGSVRKLKEKIAQLFVRVRGWHLHEKHIVIDDVPTGGAFVDFGLYFYHNIKVRLANNTATYFYLPKMEHHLECRLWNEIFMFAEDYMGIPKGKIRATVMVETLPAALEMEEMLYELRNYACGMNAGRWDYIFSAIKVLKTKPDCIMPDRKQVTMQVPFMKAYAERLVQVCHKHGASAMGGMSAFIPSRKDAEVNKNAIEQVTLDKLKEVGEGYDGTWVAHPDLVKLAKDIFMKGLNEEDNQIKKAVDSKNISVKDLITIDVEGGKVTEAGVRLNISVGLQYLDCWFQGRGAVAINNLMEDAATAEISRAQLWQWLRYKTKLEDGRTLTEELFREILQEEVDKLGGKDNVSMSEAVNIMENLALSDDFEQFLTLPGYESLVGKIGK